MATKKPVSKSFVKAMEKQFPGGATITPSKPVNMTNKQKKNPVVAPMPKMVKKMGGRGR